MVVLIHSLIVLFIYLHTYFMLTLLVIIHAISINCHILEGINLIQIMSKCM